MMTVVKHKQHKEIIYSLVCYFFNVIKLLMINLLHKK